MYINYRYESSDAENIVDTPTLPTSHCVLRLSLIIKLTPAAIYTIGEMGKSDGNVNVSVRAV